MPEIGNISGPSDVGPVEGFIPTVESLKKILSSSSLSPSQQEEIVALYLSSAPTLEPPRWNNSDVMIEVLVKLSKIGVQVWDSYLQFLQEENERIAREISSPAYQAKIRENSTMYIKEQQVIDPMSKKRIIDNNNALVSGVKDYVDNHKADNNAAPFMAMALVIAAGIITTIPTVDVVSTSMSVKPIIDAAAITTQVLPAQFIDPAAMVINLFATTMLYTATLGLVAGSQGTGEKPKNIDFARNYAKEVLAKVKSNEINQFLYAMLVHTLDNGKPVSNERADQLAAYAKLIMLSVALALYYKIETGGLTGQEFAGILKKNPYKAGSPEHDLIATINSLLGQIESFSSKKERQKILELIVGYADTNHAIDDMLKPEKVYSSLLDSPSDSEIRG